MSGEALLFMSSAWCLVVGLVTFCFSRLFLGPQKPKSRRRVCDGIGSQAKGDGKSRRVEDT